MLMCRVKIHSTSRNRIPVMFHKILRFTLYLKVFLIQNPAVRDRTG